MSSHRKPPRLLSPKPATLPDPTQRLWNAFAATIEKRVLSKRLSPDPLTLKAPKISPPMGTLSPQTPPGFLMSYPQAAVTPALDRRKLRRTKHIDRTLDLHGMTQDQAFQSLLRFIPWCFQQGHAHLLIITGKGLRLTDLSPESPAPLGGVLRRQLPQWLHHPDIRPYIHSATNTHPFPGGTGAYYVHLRKEKRK